MDYFELCSQFQQFRITSNKKEKKNKKYDEEYFPKSAKVKVYADRSAERYFWLKHPQEIDVKWTINLIPGTKQFNTVANPLRKSIGQIEIYNIYKITNKYLERQYELKKDLKDLSVPCEEYIMYHFTSEKSLHDIITNNFNWRCSGSSRGHKYGHGISFSPDAKWAEQFCKSKKFKILFVAKVLISSVQSGAPNTVLPNSGFDTTVSLNKNVYVKFEDSEFYPTYLVYYNRLK